MKIAILVESFPTISETFITNKVLHLCSRGHQVYVFTHRATKAPELVNLYRLNSIANLTIAQPAIPSSPAQWLKLVATKPQVFYKDGPGVSLKVKSRNNLLHLSLSQQHFDIIHFEFSALAILYKDVIPMLKPITVVSCRGTAEKVKPLTSPDRKMLLADIFNKIDSIHCVSADMAETIMPYCSDPSKIFINRPSIDIDYFKRGKPYVPKEKLLITTVGRFTFQKGYLIGLLAVKKLKDAGIDFEWQIVGDGPLIEEVIFHIHTLGLQEHVKLVGKKNKEQILELYNRTDVFLLSSVYEGIANVVLEAMAMEIPVVSTKSGGLAEVIDHDVDGMLAEVYDHETLASQLIELAGNFDKRKQMGAAARDKVKGHFTIQRQVNEFERRYLMLANAEERA